MNEMRLNKARLNVVSLNKALINGAVERHGSSAGGGGAPSKYIRFADPAVEAVLMANGVSSDGVGITKEDAAAVTTIGKWFNGNTTITSFNELQYFTGLTFLGASDSTSKDGAFYNCTSLQSVILPKTGLRLRRGAFSGCTSLTHVGNLDKVVRIDGYVFEYTQLTGDISLAGLTHDTIGIGAFRNNDKITGITSLGATTTIQNGSSAAHGAFAYCTSLQYVNGIEKLSYLGNSAFFGCTDLYFEYLNLSNLETLGPNALYGVKIKKLNLGKITSLPYASSSHQNYGDKGVLEEIVIPSGVTKIPDASFQNYSKLNKVTANWGGITSFGGAAFYGTLIDGDLELTNANELGQNAFRATKITSIKAHAVTKVFDSCFWDCAELHTIDLGSELTNIYQAALQNCAALETLIVRAITPPSLGTSLSGSPIASGTGIIYVPDAALEVYKTATNWSQYQDRIHPLSELEGSPYITFADPEVERVLMENNVSSDGVGITMADAQAVTSIGTWFKGNTEITSFDELQYFTGLTPYLKPPTTWNDGAFYNCTSLERVTLPPNVTILSSDFHSCKNLREVRGLEQITDIIGEAFADCSSFAMELNLENLETIANRSFSGSGITAILSLGKVKNIPGSSTWDYTPFANCTSLKTVVLPSTLESIGDNAFNYCPKMEWMKVLATTPPSMATTNTLLSTNNCLIYVPDASVEAYKTALNWSAYADRIKPLSEYVES